ncbi:MAG: hypothetical protein KDA21_11185, partial [Phycisphaerales bacterium]|nr:hypothetical protein [Phycisphaerales bacterium]
MVYHNTGKGRIPIHFRALGNVSVQRADGTKPEKIWMRGHVNYGSPTVIHEYLMPGEVREVKWRVTTDDLSSLAEGYYMPPGDYTLFWPYWRSTVAYEQEPVAIRVVAEDGVYYGPRIMRAEVVGGSLLLWRERGVVEVIDPESGDRHWSGRMPGFSADFGWIRLPSFGGDGALVAAVIVDDSLALRWLWGESPGGAARVRLSMDGLKGVSPLVCEGERLRAVVWTENEHALIDVGDERVLWSAESKGDRVHFSPDLRWMVRAPATFHIGGRPGEFVIHDLEAPAAPGRAVGVGTLQRASVLQCGRRGVYIADREARGLRYHPFAHEGGIETGIDGFVRSVSESADGRLAAFVVSGRLDEPFRGRSPRWVEVWEVEGMVRVCRI